MSIQVTCREVLNNLILFKDRLLEKRKEREISYPNNRVYIALANRHTGDLRFAQKSEDLQHPLPKKGEKMESWQEIHFVVEDRKETVQFRLTDREGAELTPKELNPLALHILFEMVNVLNKLASLYHAVSQTLPESAILQNLSDIHIAPLQESIKTALGWSGHLSRLEAEKKLIGRPPGSYLLHQGDQDEELALVLSESNKMQVKVYVLTFVESEKKISDRLVIQTERGWTFCRDESDLSSSLYKYYLDLHSLLLSIQTQVNIPI